jgi:hypothetical protein
MDASAFLEHFVLYSQFSEFLEKGDPFLVHEDDLLLAVLKLE